MHTMSVSSGIGSATGSISLTSKPFDDSISIILSYDVADVGESNITTLRGSGSVTYIIAEVSSCSALDDTTSCEKVV